MNNLKNKKLLVLFAMSVYLISLASLASVQGDASKKFVYNGQKHESFSLEQVRSETKYREEEVDDTCTRQVPYVENVCGNETRYNTECHTVPGYQECNDIPEQDCRNITRYREECYNGPSDRVCHQEDSRRVCQQGPSRRVCENEPSREVCERGPSRRECGPGHPRSVCTMENGRRVCRMEPGQEVCHDVPGERQCRTVPGREICRNVPGEQECRTVPGERVCRDVPGRRICENVPYTDQECTTSYRNVCQWIPAREVCENIPYQEYVCKDVTLYRSESYACTRTVRIPYTVTLGKIAVDFDLAFSSDDLGFTPDVTFDFILDEKGSIKIKTKDDSEHQLLIISSKNIAREGEDDDIHLTAKYKIHFKNQQKTLSPVLDPISRVNLKKDTLSFRLGKVFNANALSFQVQISKNGKIAFERIAFSDNFKVTNKKDYAQIVIDLKKMGMKLERRSHWDIAIIAKVDVKGEILNDEAPAIQRIIKVNDYAF